MFMSDSNPFRPLSPSFTQKVNPQIEFKWVPGDGLALDGR